MCELNNDGKNNECQSIIEEGITFKLSNQMTQRNAFDESYKMHDENLEMQNYDDNNNQYQGNVNEHMQNENFLNNYHGEHEKQQKTKYSQIYGNKYSDDIDYELDSCGDHLEMSKYDEKTVLILLTRIQEKKLLILLLKEFRNNAQYYLMMTLFSRNIQLIINNQ